MSLGGALEIGRSGLLASQTAIEVAGNNLANVATHFTADATNTIAAANATDQTSLNTLLNELKTDINAHMASAPTTNASTMRLVAP